MRLLMIVGQERADTIGFVDGFAGPWESETEDLSDTSIGISLDAFLKARKQFQANGWEVPRFKSLYVEQDSTRYRRLSKYIDSRKQQLRAKGVDVEAWFGDFSEQIDDILDWFERHDFVFFFIDPTGWKDISIETLRPLLERPNSEFLINFMFDFVNRAASQEEFEEHMREMFGGLGELGLDAIDDPVEREVTLVRAYRRHLNRVVSSETGYRSAYVRIKDPTADRAKYHLIYLTRSYKGIVVFMDVSEDAEGDIQPAVRAEAKIRSEEERTGQKSLFTVPEESDRDPRPAVRELKQEWLELIPTEPKAFTEEDLADLLERTDAFRSDLQQALRELIEDEIVENVDASEKSMKLRTKHFVHFEDAERLVRTTEEEPNE